MTYQELTDEQIREMNAKSERIRDMILADPDLVKILQLRADQLEERYR